MSLRGRSLPLKYSIYISKEDTMIMTLVTNALWLGFLAMFFMLCLASTRRFRSELKETDERMRKIISED